MPELRWILLALGVLFILALVGWELRRKRRSGGAGPHHAAPRETAPEPAHGPREPVFSVPEIRAREPAVRQLPVVEVDDDSMIGLRIDGQRIEEDESPGPEAAPEEPIVPAAPEPESKVRIQPDFAPTPVEPIVEWPPEGVRRILALRLVSATGERFHGRPLRQALAAEGFVLGRFSIFHKPGPDARAIVSAASLTKPGTFDLETMDTQRIAGISLFTVLPGPLPPRAAFDELLASARNLNDRLQGALQDERGEPLTPLRVAQIRESLAAEPGEAAAEPAP